MTVAGALAMPPMVTTTGCVPSGVVVETRRLIWVTPTRAVGIPANATVACDSADGNLVSLHRGGQLRGGGAGRGGRAGGNGRRDGARTGQVQSHNAAARHRGGRHDGPVRVGEQAGRGGSDGERGGCRAAVVVDGQSDRLIDRRLVGNLHVQLPGRDVVERGVDGSDGDADAEVCRASGTLDAIQVVSARFEPKMVSTIPGAKA